MRELKKKGKHHSGKDLFGYIYYEVEFAIPGKSMQKSFTWMLEVVSHEISMI